MGLNLLLIVKKHNGSERGPSPGKQLGRYQRTGIVGEQKVKIHNPNFRVIIKNYHSEDSQLN